MAMRTILDLICIQTICVLIIDNTDAIYTLKRLISRIITRGKIITDNYTLKPIDCSLCMTWWICVIYLIATHQFTIIWLCVSLMFAFFTQTTNILINALKDTIETMIIKGKNKLK